MSERFGLRLAAFDGQNGPLLILWHLLALLLVVGTPTLVRMGQPFWMIEARQLAQVPTLGLAYLAFARALFLLTSRYGGLSVIWAALAGLLCFGGASLLLLSLPRFDPREVSDAHHLYSRWVLLTGGAVGLSLATLPHVLGGQRALRVGLLVLAVAAVSVLGWSAAAAAALSGSESTGSSSRVVATALHDVRIDHHAGLADFAGQYGAGGAIASHRGHYVVATGDGDFYRVEWDGLTLRSRRLALPPVLNRDGFEADNQRVDARWFRLMDLLIDTTTAHHRLLASHYSWDRTEGCLAMRISIIDLPAEAASPTPSDSGWETFFTSQPCLPGSELSNQGGGRMAWAQGGGLYYTVGDMNGSRLGGAPYAAQDPDVDFGKVLLLDRQGHAEVLTLGHRNAQGLLVTQGGGGVGDRARAAGR